MSDEQEGIMVMGKAERCVAIESRIIDVGVSGIGLKF